jgi:UPF0755 protein
VARIIIALDVGEKRIGVAWGDDQVKIPAPLSAIAVQPGIFKHIEKLIRSLDAGVLVIGLPRNQAGQETDQSKFVRAFAAKLADYDIDVPIEFQDESLTSVVAEQRLTSRGKPYSKADIDSEAAAIILADYLEQLPKHHPVAAKLDQKSPATTKPVEKLSHRRKSPGKKLAKKPVDEQLVAEIKDKLEAKAKKRKFAWIVPVVAIVVLLSSCVLWFENAMRPVNPDNSGTVAVSIPKGRSVADTAEILKKHKLIRNETAFVIYARIYGTTVQAGLHSLSQSQSLPEIARSLEQADTAEIAVTIPDGKTLAELRDVFRSSGFSDADIDKAYDKSQYDSPILDDAPTDATLEGYIYPDTYNILVEDGLDVLIQKAINELERRVREGGLSAKFQERGLSNYQAITLASIVQQEVGNPTDQKKVAGIFYNRLRDDISLGSDVTFIYAAKLLGVEATPALDSPYNTRINKGLPPGPISNMKYSALEAVADPTASDYNYFVSGDDGTIHYAVTGEEHIENTRKYCTELCN